MFIMIIFETIMNLLEAGGDLILLSVMAVLGIAGFVMDQMF